MYSVYCVLHIVGCIMYLYFVFCMLYIDIGSYILSVICVYCAL